jgi:sugar (pentulose or hexulose) kinase
MKYYLSIDAGTSIIKIVIFKQDFKIKYKSSIENKVQTNSKGKSEINMRSFWSLTSKLIQSSLKKSKIQNKDIIGVGITGNMVGVWPVNAKGKPIRNAILWNDARSKEIFDQIQNNNPKIYQKIFDLTGSIVQFGCTIPVIKWLEKNEPQTIKKTDYFLTCKDWIRFNLTNEFNNDHTERAVAPGDIKNADLSLNIFKLLKLNKKYLNKFPQVKKSQDIAGYITSNAAKETGLLSGTPVIVGSGDVPASAIGVGAIHNNQTSTIIGTTCHNYLVSPKPIFFPKNSGLLFFSPNNQWLRTMINVAGTTNLDWIVKNFFKDQLKYKTKFQILNEFEKNLKEDDYLGNDIIYLPYLNYGGTISPFFNLNAKAEIFGLLPHHTGNDVLLAAYQGIAFSIRDCYASLDIKVKKLLLSGGGSGSKILPQIIADTLNTNVSIPSGEEFGAKGIAYLCSVALGKEKSLQSIVKNSEKNNKIVTPNKKMNAYYGSKFNKYLHLRKSLEQLW